MLKIYGVEENHHNANTWILDKLNIKIIINYNKAIDLFI